MFCCKTPFISALCARPAARCLAVGRSAASAASALLRSASTRPSASSGHRRVAGMAAAAPDPRTVAQNILRRMQLFAGLFRV